MFKVRIVNPVTKKELLKLPGAYNRLYPGRYYTSKKVPVNEVLTLTTDVELKAGGFTNTLMDQKAT